MMNFYLFIEVTVAQLYIGIGMYIGIGIDFVIEKVYVLVKP